MITIEKAQALAGNYDIEVIEVETCHDCEKYGRIPDYIKMSVKYNGAEQIIFVYLGPEYHIVCDKAFYIESKVKNALYAVK